VKHGYTCECGWNLPRTGTRRGYAAAKEEYAFRSLNSPRKIGTMMGEQVPGCEALRKELEQSRKAAVK
jgi:hypothetical protein